MAKTKAKTTKAAPAAEAPAESAVEDRVTVQMLAEEFGVSAPVMRKTLRDLAADGTIDHEPKTRWAWQADDAALEAVRDAVDARLNAEPEDEGEEAA